MGRIIKKGKSIFRKIKAKATIQTYQKPLTITILTLLGINFVVLVVAAIIANAISDEFNSFLDAFARGSLKWMLTPNSINQYSSSTDLGLVILCAIVVAIEMVLFSGAIIATLTTALRTFIDKKSKASGKLDIEDHFVILNWNSKVPDMIYNLMLKGYKDNVLILSDKNKEYITNEINSVISSNNKSPLKMKVNLIVKEGNPLLHGSLEDISISKSSTIVIMGREDMVEGDDPNISNSDLYSLKIMLALGNFNIDKDCNVIVEVDTDETKKKIEDLSRTVVTLKDKSIIPLSFNKKLGQIIGQTIINPLLANIYLDLFSYEGYEFYSYNSNISIDEFLKNYNNAIPIKNFNNLFVLGLDEKVISNKREKSYINKRILKTVVTKEEDFSTVFVIGENKKSKYLIENLKLNRENNENFNLNIYKKNDISGLIKGIKSTSGKKEVLILSDDSVGEDSYDANVFVALIELQSAFPNRGETSYITELLDSRNLNSVKDFNIYNAIISNKMMSLLITQLALNKNSKMFFESLLTVDNEEGGDVFDIAIDYVKDMIDSSESLEFISRAELVNSFYHSFGKKYMLIGYERNNNTTYFASSLDKEEKIILEREDRLIYIKF